MRRLAIVLILLAVPAWGEQLPPQFIQGSADTRPNPDPTILSQQATERAVAGLREVLEAKIKAVEVQVGRVHDESDFADARLIKRLDDVPNVIGIQLTSALKPIEQRFYGVDQQFKERDERVNQIAVLNNVALQAALSAAKEAVAKQETNTTKQLDQLYLNYKTITEAQSVQINDLKAQYASINARGSGQTDLWGYIIAGGGLVMGFAAFALTMVRAAHTERPQQQMQMPYWPPSSYPNYPTGHSPPPNVQVVPVVPVPVGNGNGANHA
jgi:hypothetical protein